MIRTDLVEDLKNGGVPAIRSKCCFRVRWYKERLSDKSKMVVHQHPDELQMLLDFISEHNVKTYTELGTQEGGLFAVVAQHINEGFVGAAVDLTNEIPDGFFDLDKKHKCTFYCNDARDYVSPTYQDLTFIDTNTRYHGMKSIYKAAAKYSRFVAFHDINDRRYGAKRVWARIKARNPGQTMEWSCNGPGIGVVMAPYH